MKFPEEVVPYLTGDRFSTGLRIAIARREREIPLRVDVLTKIVEGQKVIHLGCADHQEVIRRKRRQGRWLHDQLSDSASGCVGIDIDAEAVNQLREDGIENVYCVDIMREPLPNAVVEEKWDCVVLGEMLEHVDDPVLFLRSVRQKMSSCVDRIVCTVPNAFRYDNIRSAFHHQEFINSDHRYWFTPYTLAKVLHRAGASVDAFLFAENTTIRRKNRFKNLILRRFPALREVIVMTARL